ncbi:MAG: DNA topoisomerase I [Candidatus Methanosuratus sp.]|nr:DNA topoisomerase I [Candidatus Methanosuratincola sp.]
MEIKTLAHNGVLIPAYRPVGFKILFRGKEIRLNREQEEMAVAWVRKLGTEYAKDKVFIRNFFHDFGEALGIKGKVAPEDFDFSEIIRRIAEEKSKKDAMTKEEKKAQAAERKRIREENRQRYGYAYVNGMPVEISNYMVEPASIFMGRGDHPMRGRWKPGVRSEDITLNLSPDSPVPEPPDGGTWGGVTFDPSSLWVARWRDRLREKMKYVWLSDTAYIKQVRDIEKFNQAWELEKVIKEVRDHILAGMESQDPLQRKVATVCFLIDALKMRVGDEKDEDEADTVGATTLRPEHIRIDEEKGDVTFDFLGKDSVRWIAGIKPPRVVIENLKEFIQEGKETVFNGVRSQKVNAYLAEIMPGLTAKVFRTYHASTTTKDYLERTKIGRDEPVFVKKYHATMANLEAAKVCNHKRKLPKTWEESLGKKEERLRALKEKNAKPDRIKELQLRVKAMKATRDYNLNTSLKNYIDPRVYTDWGRRIDFDWKLYYSKSLQRRFAWVEKEINTSEISG